MNDDNNNNDHKTVPALTPDQDQGSSRSGNNITSTGTTTNTRKILQNLKRDQEAFYRRISEIAQSDIAAGPPYHEQFEKILQKSAKRIAEIDNELKKLEEQG